MLNKLMAGMVAISSIVSLPAFAVEESKFDRVLSYDFLNNLENVKTKKTDKINLTNSKKNQEIEIGFVKTDLNHSNKIFDRQENVTDKAIQILKARENGDIDDKSLYLGGRFTYSHIFEKSNTGGKFPILSRLPPQHDSSGKGNEGVINDASLNATLNYGWLTGFSQLEFTEVEYPGQDDLQLRKYYVMLGDLSKYPVYALFGRKTVSFGDFSSYAPFTHNHSSHYFWSQVDKPMFEIGYSKNDLDVTASLMRSDRGLRVVNSPGTTGHKNFAFNASKKIDTGEFSSLKIGGGFLRGTIYDSAIAHHPPSAGGNDKTWNSAVNANMTLSLYDFDFMGEYTQTLDDWPATDHKVSAFTAQARYKTEIFDKPLTYSLMFSRGEQGDAGTEWEYMMQTVAGVEAKILPNVEIGAEYLFNQGFVPLILPRVTGDIDVESHTFIIGSQITF